MAKVDPFNASASHSLSKIVAPGGLREWGSCEHLSMNLSGVANLAIPLFSGIGATGGETDEYGMFRAKIPENYSLFLYSMTCTNASNGDGDGRCLTATLNVSSTTTSSTIYGITAHAQGPYMLSQEIPIRIDARDHPQGLNVYARILTNLASGGGAGLGATNSNNWLSLNYILVENK